MFTSPHPKLSAILAALGALCIAGKAMFDGDPTTNPDWSQLGLTIMLAIGLFTARQNSVSTEEATGKTPAAKP